MNNGDELWKRLCSNMGPALDDEDDELGRSFLYFTYLKWIVTNPRPPRAHSASEYQISTKSGKARLSY